MSKNSEKICTIENELAQRFEGWKEESGLNIPQVQGQFFRAIEKIRLDLEVKEDVKHCNLGKSFFIEIFSWAAAEVCGRSPADYAVEEWSHQEPQKDPGSREVQPREPLEHQGQKEPHAGTLLTPFIIQSL